MLTRTALALALIGASVTASLAADRNTVSAWNSAKTQAQVQGHRSARQSYNAAPTDIYQLGAKIRRDTFTHD